MTEMCSFKSCSTRLVAFNQTTVFRTKLSLANSTYEIQLSDAFNECLKNDEQTKVRIMAKLKKFQNMIQMISYMKTLQYVK